MNIFRLKTQFKAGRKPSELAGMMRISSGAGTAAVACSMAWFSCVGPKSYEQLAATNDSLVTANDRMVAEAREAAQARTELEGRIGTLEKANARLERAATLAEMQSKDAQEELTRLRELNDALTEQGSAGLAALSDENRKLLEGVMKQRAELQLQEDALRKLEVDLNQRSAELNERSQRVEELEALLSSRDAAADALHPEARRWNRRAAKLWNSWRRRWPVQKIWKSWSRDTPTRTPCNRRIIRATTGN